VDNPVDNMWITSLQKSYPHTPVETVDNYARFSTVYPQVEIQ